MADNQSNSNSTNEAGENPQENLSATNGDAVSKAGLWQYLAELVLAGAVGTGVWLFGEHLVSHGHSFLGSVVNFVAFCIYFATVPITTVKVWPHPKLVWLSFCGFCILMALAFIFSSRPSTESKPHFTFMLLTTNEPNSILELTNDFLVFNKRFDEKDGEWGPTPGILFIPKPEGQSNLVLRFAVKNDSSVLAKDMSFLVSFPKPWDCIPAPGWHGVMPFRKIMPPDNVPVKSIDPNESRFLAFEPPSALLEGNGITLPDITLLNVSDTQAGLFKIVARVTGSGPQAVGFLIIFVPPSMGVFHKPFVQLGTIGPDGLLHIPDSAERLMKLQK